MISDDGVPVLPPLLVKALVKNIRQPDAGYSSLQNDYAQGFMTGGNGTGYTLNSAEVAFLRLGTLTDFSKLEVTVRTSASGRPGDVVATLANSGSQGRRAIFTAPKGGVKLSANTRYFLVLDVTGKVDNSRLAYTLSDKEDPGAAPGWSIDDGSLFRASGIQWSTVQGGYARKIRLRGFANPQEHGKPTALTLSVDADTGAEGVQTSLVEEDGSKTVRVTATLDGPATFAEPKTVTIAVGAVDDSATESTDYQEVANQRITIPVGQSSASVEFQITPVDDNLYEGSETISIAGTLTDVVVRPAAILLTDEADDAPEPTVVSIERYNPATSPTNANSLTWRVTFDEAVVNVDAGDFTLTGPNAGTTLTVSTVTGKEATTWDITASSGNLATFDGPVMLSFAADQNIQDNDGTPLSATTPRGTNENSYVVDNTAPTVTSVARQSPSTSPTNANSLTWRVTFGEAVNVAASDFMVTGTDAVLSAMPVGHAGTTVDVTVSGGNLASLNGPVTLGFATDQYIQDKAGNVLDTTTTPSPNDATYDLDNAPPTVAVSGLSGTLSGPVTATFTFSETVSGFAQEDITVGNGAVSDFTVSIAGMVWTALITPTADGTVTVDVGAGAAMDAAGNPNPAATQASAAYTAVPGIALIPRSLSVAEAGGKDTYTVVLNTQPTHAVTVTVTSADASTATVKKVGGGAGASQTLTFTTSNWNTAQTVTVTGVDDAVDNQGDKRTVSISHAARSTDTNYTIADAGSVTVTVTDDEDIPTALTLTLDAGTGTTGSLLRLAENVGTKTVRVTATLDGPATFAEPKTVPIAVGAVDDSATESTDYQ
ncbi:MAG: hypothetical protein F4016_12810, partial [Acidimicrobiaceae bacterium]|nr:hypothetical protein [Acidimicrobiaceae bacterium]